jgi:xylulokinase
MSFLGIDLGATFIKAAWLDVARGQLTGEVREEFPGFIGNLADGFRECDPEEIYVRTTNLLRKMLSGHTRCDGLFISGQMHGFVLVGDDGFTKSNYYSWQDSRTLRSRGPDKECDFESARKLLGSEVIADLGNEFRPGSPASVLFSLSRSGALRRGLWAASLPDYVAYRMTGHKGPIHVTHAAAHGIFDMMQVNWHMEAISILGLKDLWLPALSEEVVPVGKCRVSGVEFDVFTPVGDQQAALLGVGLLESEISVNVATGSQVSKVVTSSSMGPWQLRPYFYGKRLRTITHLPAGRALNSLVSMFEEVCPSPFSNREKVWELIAQKASSLDQVSTRINLSFFPCTTGYEGSIMHLKEEELTLGHLFLAAFRSMAENYGQVAEKLGSDNNDIVVLSGGLVQKLPVLVREIRRAMQRECRLAPCREDALMGLLHLAEHVS